MQLLQTTAAALDIDISASSFQFAWAISETVAQCHVYPLEHLLLGLVSKSADTAVGLNFTNYVPFVIWTTWHLF
jgi:hypothetical protein